MPLRTLHRTSAILIMAFVCLHLVNHLVALQGVAAHIAFMKAARAVYRQPLVEVLLLACVAFQVFSGSRLALRGWRQRRGVLPWLQALSGTYLVVFLLVHVGAVLFGRAVLNLDTNFYFSAAGFHVSLYPILFAPYYFFGVFALFTHLGCAAYWHVPPSSRTARTLAVVLPMAVGATLALLIVLSLAGMIQPVDVPAEYKATYGG
jgi:succinate dehydrogenase/fumarate reductase cytochrome b subunit